MIVGNADWSVYADRFKRGEWRAPIFRDLILHDARLRRRPLTILDIGCGRGFDGDIRLQKSIAAEAGMYIGIEPDSEITIEPIFSAVYRCLFEDAPLGPTSIDLAFAVMVLEHIAEPKPFLERLANVLASGGIFWGFTMDARHYFTRVSQWADTLALKEAYLNRLRGARGVDRYENYPVFYRLNSPEQFLRHGAAFKRIDFISMSRVGQLDHYVPKPLRFITKSIDRLQMARGKPGSILVVRLEK
jgi:SAM-dependent methyltransferase